MLFDLLLGQAGPSPSPTSGAIAAGKRRIESHEPLPLLSHEGVGDAPTPRNLQIALNPNVTGLTRVVGSTSVSVLFNILQPVGTSGGAVDVAGPANAFAASLQRISPAALNAALVDALSALASAQGLPEGACNATLTVASIKVIVLQRTRRSWLAALAAFLASLPAGVQAGIAVGLIICCLLTALALWRARRVWRRRRALIETVKGDEGVKEEEEVGGGGWRHALYALDSDEEGGDALTPKKGVGNGSSTPLSVSRRPTLSELDSAGHASTHDTLTSPFASAGASRVATLAEDPEVAPAYPPIAPAAAMPVPIVTSWRRPTPPRREEEAVEEGRWGPGARNATSAFDRFMPRRAPLPARSGRGRLGVRGGERVAAAAAQGLAPGGGVAYRGVLGASGSGTLGGLRVGGGNIPSPTLPGAVLGATPPLVARSWATRGAPEASQEIVRRAHARVARRGGLRAQGAGVRSDAGGAVTLRLTHLSHHDGGSPNRNGRVNF